MCCSQQVGWGGQGSMLLIGCGGMESRWSWWCGSHGDGGDILK